MLPEIHSIPDFREFLKLYAESAKKRRPNWSYGAWAKSLGLKSASSITKVVHGQRQPGPDLVDRLIRYFKFYGKEEEHFRNLILLARSGKNAHIQKMILRESEAVTAKKFESRMIEICQFHLLSDWWHYSVRELLKLKKFDRNPRAIAKLFRRALSPNQIRESFSILERLSLIRRNAKLEFEVVDATVSTPSGIRNEALQKYHSQMLGIAQDRIRDVPPDRRHFHGFTFLLHEKNLPKAKMLIQEFVERFDQLLDPTDATALYQMQVQLFPLTEDFKKSHEVNPC
jgi:uncharacterized protein (TIGR02147 family)